MKLGFDFDRSVERASPSAGQTSTEFRWAKAIAASAMVVMVVAVATMTGIAIRNIKTGYIEEAGITSPVRDGRVGLRH